eukprot:TRINITY_DN6048_c0_g3_i1.p1 TRINITY_DN6048_c0_g3~~TRINITY_DN6048_c0_g3_i1.p1  ORF type:complete len:578 (-),score=87.58 TRINITY_DN6048_c0_g3_i1:482-2215(-)
MTIEEIIHLKESEDKVEFKEAKGGDISYNGGKKPEPNKRRRCILGYVIALANEGGGFLIFGIKESLPHVVVGTQQNEGSLGLLEGNVYRDTGIRVSTEELFDNEGKRVVVLRIPARPFGKVYKFEDVALMRVGEELRPMSDEQYLKIIQEQEPDFSEKICEGITVDDLDDDAINKMREAYAKKQNNSQFLTLTKEQVLNDLALVVEGKVTNAAVILLGKKETVKHKLPQSALRIEYRKSESQITFDQRKEFQGPYFVEAEKIWEMIDLRNGSFPIQDGPFIFDIPYFNKEVIREAINNAFAHRNYRLSSETVIKQYPSRLDIISPGGFPIGVNLCNIISTSSTPRNRLLTDILQKTGVVERSGQGIDKIYYQTLKEGKSAPDYSKSDDFQVELILSATIEDKAFALFVESVQSELADAEKLSVYEIITLNKIKEGDSKNLDRDVIKRLLDRNLIEQRGKTSGTYYVLSKDYFEFADEKGKYSKAALDENQAFSIILQHLGKFESAKMKDFGDLFDGQLTRKQVRTIVKKLVENKSLSQHGEGKGSHYKVGENFQKRMNLIGKALDIGFQQLKKNGDL